MYCNKYSLEIINSLNLIDLIEWVESIEASIWGKIIE